MRSVSDTIAAISSAAGIGGRGLVRVTGPDALTVVARVFVADGEVCVADVPGRACLSGRVRVGDDVEVPGRVIVFRQPGSYTGQDLVEVHTLGSPTLVSMVLERVLASGARMAEAGEFTARAFIGGKLDLAQAEGVAASIASQSDGQMLAAEQLLEGVLSQRTGAICDELAGVLALVEAEIDFAEEPIDFIDAGQVRTHIAQAHTAIDGLLEHSVAVEQLAVWPRVMLVGPTNAGKSSLMNRLTGLNRAICSPLPSATRDVLTAPLSLPSGQVQLVDGAGLVDAPCEMVDTHAMDVARKAAQTADLRLIVIDVAAPVDVDGLVAEFGGRPAVVVANKTDLIDPSVVSERVAVLGSDGQCVVAVSAMTGDGCDALIEAIVRRVHGTQAELTGQTVAINARHRRALAEATEALGRADELCASGDVLGSAELLATELREAIDQLGLIAGTVATEDLLDRIFGEFCIGK